jgi:hypothetical protein
MHAEQRYCVLYTLADGPLPVYSAHLSCEGTSSLACAYMTDSNDYVACGINYHHNVKVFKGERTYYGGVPNIIQISEHQFVERPMIEMWLALMDQWYVRLTYLMLHVHTLAFTRQHVSNCLHPLL